MAPLLGAAAALTLAGWPRWTSDTLLHTMALSWFLCALLLYRLTTPRQRFWCCGVILVISASSLLPKVIAPWYAPLVETRVGALRDPRNQEEILDGLEGWVNPGDTLFSFPYLPSAYFLLSARNPSRYTFLQPGMMTPDDERRAVAELQLAPPLWVIYENFPQEAVFRIWPGTDPARIPMTTMKKFERPLPAGRQHRLGHRAVGGDGALAGNAVTAARTGFAAGCWSGRPSNRPAQTLGSPCWRPARKQLSRRRRLVRWSGRSSVATHAGRPDASLCV